MSYDPEKMRKTLSKYGDMRSKEIIAHYKRAQDELVQKIKTVFERTIESGTWSWVDMNKFGRAEKLFQEINTIVKKLGGKEIESLTDILKDVYKEEYARKYIELYRDILDMPFDKVKKQFDLEDYEQPYYNILKETPKGDLAVSFHEIPEDQVAAIMTHPWSGANFSSRIWNDKTKLINTMREQLTLSMVMGESMGKAAKRIKDTMGNSAYNSERLARTEIMRASNEAHELVFNNAGIGKVEWYAAKDERVCATCGERHEQKYPLDDKPIMPAHPNCRCTWIPVVEGIEEIMKEPVYKIEKTPKVEKVEKVEEPVKSIQDQIYTNGNLPIPERMQTKVTDLKARPLSLNDKMDPLEAELFNFTAGGSGYSESSTAILKGTKAPTPKDKVECTLLKMIDEMPEADFPIYRVEELGANRDLVLEEGKEFTLGLRSFTRSKKWTDDLVKGNYDDIEFESPIVYKVEKAKSINVKPYSAFQEQEESLTAGTFKILKVTKHDDYTEVLLEQQYVVSKAQKAATKKVEEVVKAEEKKVSYKTYSGSNAVKYGRQLSAKNTPKLTNQELKALDEYVQGSQNINTIARTGVAPSHMRNQDYITEIREKIIPNINAALNKGEITDNIVVYRGANAKAIGLNKGLFEQITEEELKNIVGTYVSDPGFMSTSLDKKATEYFNRGVLMEIQVPKGTNGLYVSDLNGRNLDEAEILFPRDTTMKIVGYTKKGDDIVVTVEIVEKKVKK